MNLNKWTVALAGAGLISLPAIARAQTNSILSDIASTTISGYVDTSAQWNFGTGNANNPPYAFGGAGKADGFNLDVVDIALDKPLDDSLWSAGYHVELWMGPDANALGTQASGTPADFAIRQAYVALRTPIGNGIVWKLGVWDTIIGYEGLTSYNNPNYTHSYGFSIEPTTHTGLLGTYQVNDQISISGGVANSFGPQINGRAGSNESFKTWMGSIAFTAPTNWGWAAGSVVSAGIINGYNAASAEGSGDKQTSVYAGATLATPFSPLKLGASLDYVDMHNYRTTSGADNSDGSIWAVALYANFQATEKLALNLRGEWVDDRADYLMDTSDLTSNYGTPGPADSFRAIALTATAQYDLWKNVISRVEFRWDHGESAALFGGNQALTPTLRNTFMLAANVIYKF